MGGWRHSEPGPYSDPLSCMQDIARFLSLVAIVKHSKISEQIIYTKCFLSGASSVFGLVKNCLYPKLPHCKRWPLYGPLQLITRNLFSKRTPVKQRPKNPYSALALLSGKFLRVRKVFARMIEIVIQKSPICLVSLNKFQTR